MFLVSSVFHHIKYRNPTFRSFNILNRGNAKMVVLSDMSWQSVVHSMSLNWTKMCTLESVPMPLWCSLVKYYVQYKAEYHFHVLLCCFMSFFLSLLMCHVSSWFPLLASSKIAKLFRCVYLFDCVFGRKNKSVISRKKKKKCFATPVPVSVRSYATFKAKNSRLLQVVLQKQHQ